METLSLILIMMPIFSISIAAMNIDIIWFRIIITIMIEWSLITPPVGLKIYVLKAIGNINTASNKKPADNKKQQNKRKPSDPNYVHKIDHGNSMFMGNPNARVTVTEFFDFQWPYCARSVSLVDDILKKYPDDVKVVIKNFPLSFHKQAYKAAQYALAAREQGKYKELYYKIFEDFRSLKNNDDPFTNAGIEQTWEFAHPNNKKFTGPLERFKTMLSSDSYKMLLNHIDHNIVEVKTTDSLASYEVTILGEGKNYYKFRWMVQK